MSHWHIAYGIAGYGPDGADGFACAETLSDAAETARDYLRESAEYLEEGAHASAEAGDFEQAWKDHAGAIELATMRANLDGERANAPLYRDRPGLWEETLVSMLRESFPVDVSHSSRLYVWECDEEECEHLEDDSDA